ncbi:crossover junction endonuclease MUS81 [Triticum aestivum]|uniref:crossover junction endonuclease MUS81 n=1 Tax=Triticum aestivum TaxID=4565 RepID=UPI001D00B901|nr:crossover junction endonuclease MUS81-like [Triticum aestivum]
MAPLVPKKKRKVNLPENEEVAARIFGKHRSMAAQQPGGFPEHQARALSAAYTGVCAAKEPVRTPGDLARVTGVGGWVVDVMEDSFPGSSLDLSPPRSNTPGETGKKNTRNKPYVPRMKSAAYAIMIALCREMEKGKEFMMRQELIDAAEASGLSQYAIGPNNSRNSRNDGYSFTGWNSMKTLTNKDLVEKRVTLQSNVPGSSPSIDCELLTLPGPLTAAGHPAVVLSDSDSDEYDGSSPLIGINKVLKEVDFQTQKQAVPVPLTTAMLLILLFHLEECLDSNRLVQWPRSRRKVVDNIRSQFNIPVEVKHLPVGDALWIARHKELDTDYVLDFIVERKNVEDLLGSIKDNRYKDQKLRLKKCGLRKLIYLVEGDVNTVDGSESVKTACFTTEVLEGFDVQRTTGYADTEKKYGHLTGSIIDCYSRNFSAGADTSRLCLTYDEFVKRCSDLEKVTMSDIFAVQLMQVPQVTEEAALAVTSLYPTLLSLAKAYTMLDGDRCAQEEMLQNKSDMVNAGASKNIFKLIWAEG